MNKVIWFCLALLFSINVLADFELFATHIEASTQSTTEGKKIQAIKLYNGSLYLGYGDYGANTGPIKICKITPPSNAIVCEFTLSTEQINRYRILNNKLYAVATDPSAPNQHAYAVKNSTGWRGESHNSMSQGSIRPAHIFDIIQYDDKLWAIGSQHSSAETNVPPFANDGDATVWVSSNGGSTWSVSLDVHQIDNCCARFYFAGVVNNKLYVQAVDYDELHPASRVFNGTSWAVGPNLLTFGVAQKAGSFINQMIMIQSGRLVSFDGDLVTLRYSDIVDYVIDGSRIYVLKSDQYIYSSSDLVNWSYEDRLTVSADPTSVAVLKGEIFIGTSNSEIYRTVTPTNSNIIPILQLLLLDD